MIKLIIALFPVFLPVDSKSKHMVFFKELKEQCAYVRFCIFLIYWLSSKSKSASGWT